ncbi:MAG: hypothetical protein EOP38_00175 [Rubrivivax sp.]|nr:MAG: hypothetical protein EOP38_00175 [Rubrivivax sp.]
MLIKTVLSKALEAFDHRYSEEARQELSWSTSYPLHFRRMVEGALENPDATLSSAQAGLKAAWASFRWKDVQGERPLDELIAHLGHGTPDGFPSFETLTLKGGAVSRGAIGFSLPYKGQLLQGDALLRQAEHWVLRGVIEESAAKALTRCVENPEWFDLSDRTVVLLSAGSKTGPLCCLTQWKANIVAVDIASPGVWKRIAAQVEQGNATLHAPVRRGRAKFDDWTVAAGVDLLQQTLEIAEWVRSFPGPLDVAAQVEEGDRQLRLAAAMDFVQAVACRGRSDTTLAFLTTPADVFAVPCAPAVASLDNFNGRPLPVKALQGFLNLVAGGRFFRPNVDDLVPGGPGGDYGVVDGLLLQQGPSYALAQRIQQWRALIARQEGHRVSINMAPLTNAFMAASILGVEIFEPETKSALMAALWVHDLRKDIAMSNPAVALNHPLDLLVENACHGGLWRGRYRPRSVPLFNIG